MAIGLTGKQGLWSLLKQAFIWRFSVIWYLVALLLAPLLMLSAASYCAMAVHEDIALPRVAFGTVLLIFLIMVVRGGPVNEELGWRGYLLPHLLQRHNPFWATLVLTPIWTAWHGPLWLMRGVPHSHWPWIYFAMMVAPIAFLFTWFYLRTGR